MIISVINRSKTIPDTEVQTVIRAINRQIKEDFEPYWSFGATLRLEGTTTKTLRLNSQSDVRGDAVLYIVDGVNRQEADGWHDKNLRDIPYGLVFLGMCKQADEPWSLTFSHEALELVGDPMGNLAVEGNDPKDRRKRVWHMFEMCDAVQNERYTIEGVVVSNFVLPSYFTLGEQKGKRNDFLGTVNPDGSTLKSFDTNPGGYVNIQNPKTKAWEPFLHQDDEVARKRQKLKAKLKLGRGYKRSHPGKP